MVFTHLVPTTEGGFQLHDITEQKRMYQQQVLCALPADVLAKVIVVVDNVSEDNSSCTPKEGVINLLSKVRVGDPTTSGLVNYLWAAAPFGIYFWQNGTMLYQLWIKCLPVKVLTYIPVSLDKWNVVEVELVATNASLSFPPCWIRAVSSLVYGKTLERVRCVCVCVCVCGYVCVCGLKYRRGCEWFM